MSNQCMPDGISRRNLMKTSAISGLALAVSGISLPFGLRAAATAVGAAVSPTDDKVVWGACSVMWGGVHFCTAEGRLGLYREALTARVWKGLTILH